MKFSISINLERFDPSDDVNRLIDESLELVQLAEKGGFDIAWAPEHHMIEFTIGPNPLTMLTHWGAHTRSIRLGTAVLVAPYWHPIRLAGESALVDLLTDGRLELGIARGAYQYEFDRMANGIPQQQGVAYLKEILPAVKNLWAGDYEHKGEHWNFPKATSVPKPKQSPHPPLWVAARDPGTFDWAIKNGVNILTTPLSRPISEVEVLAKRFEETLSANPKCQRPKLLMLRRTCVYEDDKDWRIPVDASIEYGRHFENLFKNLGDVTNGFPEPVDASTLENREEFDPAFIHNNMLFGTPTSVVEKLKVYEANGVDNFCYGASFGLPHEAAKRSLQLFIDEVMPHFQ